MNTNSLSLIQLISRTLQWRHRLSDRSRHWSQNSRCARSPLDRNEWEKASSVSRVTAVAATTTRFDRRRLTSDDPATAWDVGSALWRGAEPDSPAAAANHAREDKGFAGKRPTDAKAFFVLPVLSSSNGRWVCTPCRNSRNNSLYVL